MTIGGNLGRSRAAHLQQRLGGGRRNRMVRRRLRRNRMRVRFPPPPLRKSLNHKDLRIFLFRWQRIGSGTIARTAILWPFLTANLSPPASATLPSAGTFFSPMFARRFSRWWTQRWGQELGGREEGTLPSCEERDEGYAERPNHQDTLSLAGPRIRTRVSGEPSVPGRVHEMG